MSLLNVLALHGKYQSAEVFRTRIGRLPHKAKSVAKFTFIDAPHLLELRPEDSVPMRTWFFRDGNTIIQESLDLTLSYIEDVWRKDGPFDGIFGFSMGGSMASMLATDPLRFPGVRFILIGGSPDVPSHLIDESGASRIPKYIKSMHLIGQADTAVPPPVSHRLASRYTDPIVIEHEQGHCVPTRAVQLEGYVRFMEQFLVDPSETQTANEQAKPITSTGPKFVVESVEVCQMQNEEVEVLSSIYSSDEFSIIGDLPQQVLDPTLRCKSILTPSFTPSTIPHNWVGNLGIQFTLQSSYPLKPNQPPLIEILTGNLSLLDFSLAHKRSLLQTIQQVAKEICQNEGETCLMQCIQAGNDWLSDGGRIIEVNSAATAFPIQNEPEDEEVDSSEVEIKIETSILKEIDEQVENEWIKQATIEAGHAAAFAKNRNTSYSNEFTQQLQSEDNIIASASARGIWNYTVGLVGKPSAGKSTFYNAVTRAILDARGHRHLAEVAPHPFTTIEPNIGPGWYVSFQEESIENAEPLHGWCELKQGLHSFSGAISPGSSVFRRLLPIIVKDVAGLVPGAYKGRGKGNRFLADLCDADVLVHVVDSTGQSDKDGNILIGNDDTKHCSNPSEDAEWIRQELHRWIYNNIKAKWDSVFRKGVKGGMSRVLALFSGYHGPLWNVELAAKRAQLNFDLVTQWTAQDLHRLVAHYLSIRFPICLALNKVDSLSDIAVIQQCQQEAFLRGEVAVPVSARADCWLQQKLSHKNLPHVESNEYKLEESRLQSCIEKWGGTGVLEAISEAVKLKQPVLVYPVCDLDSELPVGWAASMTNDLLSAACTNPALKLPKLRDCLQFKQGSTVDDVFESLKHGALPHATIQGDFIRAEGKPLRKLTGIDLPNRELRKHQLKRETILDDTNAIIRIQTNKKSVWQHSSHS